MLIIISLVLLVVGFVKKDSKLVLFLLMLLVIVLFAGNTYNADSLAYSDNYSNIANGKYDPSFEQGFQILNAISFYLGLSYNQFLLIVSSVGILLIVSTMKIYTASVSYVMCLYILYPFVWDTIQVRNFLAMAILIFGSRYIISEKKNYHKYFLCIIIASTMHITALFYLVGILVSFKDTKKIGKVVFTIITVSTIIISIMMPYVIDISGSRKLEIYFMTQTSWYTKIFIIVYCSFSIGLMLMAKKIIDIESGVITKLINIDSPAGLLGISNVSIILENSRKTRNKLLDNCLDIYQKIRKRIAESSMEVIPIDTDAVLKLNILSMLPLYLLLNNLDFIRLYRNIFILNYIIYSVALNKCQDKRIKNIFITLIIIFISISFYFLNIYIPENNIFKHIFENNLVLNF